MSKNKKTKPPFVAAVPALSSGSRILAWISLAWAAWVIYMYWNRYPWLGQMPPAPALSAVPTQWNVLWLDAKALLLGITSILGMTAAGSYLLRYLRLPWNSFLEEAVFSMGIGFGATGYLLLALGLLQAYRAPVFWCLWAAGLGLAWHRWFRNGTEERWNRLFERWNQWNSTHQSWWLHKALLAVVLATACLMTFVPEIFYDAMVYHLGIPQWYLFEGGICYYPSVTAQFPFLRQMLNVWGLALEGERLAKLLHASSAPLLIATYHVLAARYSSPKTMLIASLAFFSMPMVNMNLWTTGVDIGLASYALLCFLAWLNGLSDSTMRTRWFALAGVLGGYCFASKYPGLLIPAFLCVTMFLWLGFAEKDWLGALRHTVFMGLVTSATALPWLLKTWWMTGNPVYPYLFHWWGGRDLLQYRVTLFLSDTGGGAKTQLLELLKTPWTGTFVEISSLGAPGLFVLGFLGYLFTGTLRKELRPLWYIPALLFFVLYWFCINAMTDRIRLGIPGLAIGCFVLAHTAGTLYANQGSAFRFLLAGVVAVSALLGLLSTVPTLYNAYHPWDVLAGKESRENYLSYTHPGVNPYPATRMFHYAKTVVPPDHRLLIIGDEKVSSCPIPFLATGAFNDSLIVEWSRSAKTPGDLLQTIKDHKVSHFMINIAEAQRLIHYKILDWDERSLKLFSDFFNRHARLVRNEPIVERFFNQSSPVLLYEVMDPPPASPPSQNVLLEIYEMDRARRAS